MAGAAFMMPESENAPSLTFELSLHRAGLGLVAGLDEAGRGALAGPVTAAAVILPLDDQGTVLGALEGVRDSKQMTPDQRERALKAICDLALGWAVGSASPGEIDTLGLVPATRRAMARALAELSLAPEYLLLDYLLLPGDDRPQTALVRGDRRSLTIAAASVVAKVTRDKEMVALEDRYPGYGLAQHKGYGTADHRAALERLGPTPVHRKSYAPVAASLH